MLETVCEALERDPCVAEEKVAGTGVGDEVDRDELDPPLDADLGREPVDGPHPRGDRLVGARETALRVEAHATVP